MNPVSFGSLYRIYSVSNDKEEQKKGLNRINEYCKANKIFSKTKTYSVPPYDDRFGKDAKLYAITSVSAERHQDHDIDMICANYMLKHDKVGNKGTYTRYWNDKPLLRFKA